MTSRLRLRAQRGQALTEFVVIALALVPLFLLMPMVAKYLDIAHATQMASRYVAFEAMTHNDENSYKSVSQLNDEIARRFFGASTAPIKSGDTAGNYIQHRNAFWKDPAGNPLIKDFSKDLQVSFGLDAKGSSHEQAFGKASDRYPFVVAADALDLESRGHYTANVTVKLAKIQAPEGFTNALASLDNLDLSMTRHTTLVVNPWTGRKPEDVQKRLDKPAVFPGGMLASAKSVTKTAVALVELPSCFDQCNAPKLGELEFWKDVVPEDRVK